MTYEEDTLWFAFQGGRLLLERTAPDDSFRVPVGGRPPVEPDTDAHVHTLPPLEGHPCRAFALAEQPVDGERYVLTDLRSTFDLLPRDHYLRAGKAEELVFWDLQTRYCSRCATPLRWHSSISKCCPTCGREVWPQLTTAIIVLVHRGDEALLVQARNFRGDYLGLVAGFVETGETLEECVQREVMEETNVRVRNIRYFGSQPWPYPSGLMVGFTAEFESGELRLQRSELNKGGWYRKDALPPIPGKASMARMLLDAWVEGRI